MSKKKATTQSDLEAMGLFETSPGKFSKVDPKHETIGFEIGESKMLIPLGIINKDNPPPKIDWNQLREDYGLSLPDVDLEDPEKNKNFVFRKKGEVIQIINPELEFQHSPEEMFRMMYKQGIQYLNYPDNNRRTEPFPIAEIRELTGKKRSIAVEELHEAAKGLVRDLGPTDIYIPTNVASSKNSKQLFKTGKKNAQVTRDAQGNTSTVIKETSFITDSQVSKAYRKQTEDSWKVNRLKFLAAVQGLPKPYSIELTFIRTTLGKFDLHNMAQLPFDLMVEHGWIEDDESVEVHPVFNKCIFYSKHFAGLVIRVIR